MSRLERLAVVLVILVSLVPLYLLIKWVQRKLQPRKSLLHLISYFLAVFILIFGYSFLVVYLILQLFPPPKG